jgi:hypothetical protein
LAGYKILDWRLLSLRIFFPFWWCQGLNPEPCICWEALCHWDNISSPLSLWDSILLNCPGYPRTLFLLPKYLELWAHVTIPDFTKDFEDILPLSSNSKTAVQKRFWDIFLFLEVWSFHSIILDRSFFLSLHWIIYGLLLFFFFHSGNSVVQEFSYYMFINFLLFSLFFLEFLLVCYRDSSNYFDWFTNHFLFSLIVSLLAPSRKFLQFIFLLWFFQGGAVLVSYPRPFLNFLFELSNV